jgi:hypothetical protein
MLRLVHCTREKLIRPWLNWSIIWHLFNLGFREDKLITEIMASSGEIIDDKMREKEMNQAVSGKTIMVCN